MDRITDISEQLAVVMGTIDATAILPSGYTFYSTVGGVNVDDEAILNGVDSYPIIDIEPSNETTESGNFKAYRNLLSLKLRCGVANTVTRGMSPMRASDIKMNEILSDVKYALSDNPTLNGTCDIIYITGSEREYNTTSSGNRAGDIIITVDIDYSQSRLNPNLNACI